jgi:Predicted dienelactone hydrolase
MRAKFILIWALLIPSALAQKPLWEGQFNAGPLWGGMDLRISGNTVEARFTPWGQTITPKLENIHLASNTISFATEIDEKPFAFQGKLHGENWTGTMSSSQLQGAWRLTKIQQPNLSSHNTLPAAIGPYSIARQTFDWTDNTREELDTKTAGDHRELLVYLYYPAKCPATGTHVPYMPDAQIMDKDWTPQQIEEAKHLTTHACADAPVISDRDFPLLLFMPGSGQRALAYSALIENAASSGYVVAAIDPPYNASALQFPDGRVVRRLPPDQRSWEIAKSHDDAPRIYKQLVTYWCKDMSFVLDQLQSLQQQQNPLASAIDFSRVGAFGHSRGGSTAGRIRLLDSRIRAAINIDGNIRGVPFPPEENDKGGKQPFLWLEKQIPWPNASQLKQMGLTHEQMEDMLGEGDRLLSTIPSDAYHVVIAQPGIDHLDFSDQAMFDSKLTQGELAQKLRTLEIARIYVTLFFDAYLKGTPSNFHKDFEKENRRFAETKILFPTSAGVVAAHQSQ